MWSLEFRSIIEILAQKLKVSVRLFFVSSFSTVDFVFVLAWATISRAQENLIISLGSSLQDIWS